MTSENLTQLNIKQRILSISKCPICQGEQNKKYVTTKLNTEKYFSISYTFCQPVAKYCYKQGSGVFGPARRRAGRLVLLIIFTAGGSARPYRTARSGGKAAFNSPLKSSSLHEITHSKTNITM
jgi:hypothetical protein